jgi:hypothetical protein
MQALVGAFKQFNTTNLNGFEANTPALTAKNNWNIAAGSLLTAVLS